MKKANKQAANTETDNNTSNQVETGGETGNGEGGNAEDIPVSLTRLSSFTSRANVEEFYSIYLKDPFEDIYEDPCFNKYH